MENSSDTTSLLRPNQVAEMNDEIRGLEDMLNAPPHIRAQISDRGGMRKRADRLKKDAEKYTPRAYGPGERDAAVTEFETLADSIREGMPSSEEMRRNPPGAVGKQIAWEKRNKTTVARYKHVALRLQEGGDLPVHLRHAGDAANIELLRPLTTRRDLSMDGAQIRKTADIHIGADPAGTVIFSADEEQILKDDFPAVYGSLGTMDNAQRQLTKAFLQTLMAGAPTPADASEDTLKDVPPATIEKPTPAELTFSQMKSMGAKAGLKVGFGWSKAKLIEALRARHLIR